MSTDDKTNSNNFIRNIVVDDLKQQKHDQIVTRFPPEPNGYLHIGHAKSICLNFGLAEDSNGYCNLRFDDTNPEKESEEYMQSIKKDVEWLGFHWKHLCHASDYFEQIYEYAIHLIKNDKAYVDSLTPEEIREYRGTLTNPGKNSPDRARPIEENLDLFEKMRAGKFEDGTFVLRAKIDMSSPNINLRDPILYRIRRVTHFKTGDKWCIYPTYDFTHGLSDAIEGITHSICTLEFEDHRPLYDWLLDAANAPTHPQQIEFARLQLEYTISSKRKLNQLVQEDYVNSWDDPRMPTISGMRRRGITPEAIRTFCERIGVTKKDSSIEMSALETCIREDLDKVALRAMAVINPVKVIITNYPDDQVENLKAANHPNNEDMGKRTIPFSKEIYIEHDDFLEEPPRKFFRLKPGGEVRLRNAYIIKCEHIIKDNEGNIQELHCTYDPETLGKNPEDRKVKGVIHWVSASHAIDAEVRLYDRLFQTANPAASENFLDELNPNSLTIFKHAKLEPSLANATTDKRFQFERQGYFYLDCEDSTEETPVFNRTITLRDSWAKLEKQK